MKKMRIVLSAMAVVLALVGALASQPLALEDGYQFIDNPAPQPDQCSFVSKICDQDGTYPCQVNTASPRLHRMMNATACGIELNRIDAPPAP